METTFEQKQQQYSIEKAQLERELESLQHEEIETEPIDQIDVRDILERIVRRSSRTLCVLTDEPPQATNTNEVEICFGEKRISARIAPDDNILKIYEDCVRASRAVNELANVEQFLEWDNIEETQKSVL